MKLLEMMNFVLILVIAMMPRSSLTFRTRISIAFTIVFVGIAAGVSGQKKEGIPQGKASRQSKPKTSPSSKVNHLKAKAH